MLGPCRICVFQHSLAETGGCYASDLKPYTDMKLQSYVREPAELKYIAICMYILYTWNGNIIF